MWNSGGKNIWKPQTKEGHVSYAVPGLFPMAKPQFESAFDRLPQLQTELGDIGSRLMQGVEGLDIGVGEDALRRAMLNKLLPGYAARGLATSGPGIDIERDVEGQLSQTRFERAAKRQELLQQAAQGLAVLKALPEQLRQQLLAIIVGQGGTGVPMASTGSMLQQTGDYMGGMGRLASGIAML